LTAILGRWSVRPASDVMTNAAFIERCSAGWSGALGASPVKPSGEQTSRGEITVRKDAMNWQMGQHSEAQHARTMPRATPYRDSSEKRVTPTSGSGSSCRESAREEARGSTRHRLPGYTLERTNSKQTTRSPGGRPAQTRAQARGGLDSRARVRSERAPRWMPKGQLPEVAVEARSELEPFCVSRPTQRRRAREAV